MKLILKLLRKHISAGQLASFAIANTVGAFIVLAGIQIFLDINPIFNSPQGLVQDSYLVISKEVSLLSNLSGKSLIFSDKEIEDVDKQPFVLSVGKFTSSSFSVYGSVRLSLAASLSTEMFFESVPDQYLDVQPEEWDFSPLNNEIPIIIPRNYLNLYNYGFAGSRSMPKLSESMIGGIPIEFQLEGNGLSDQYKGKVAGFSNRLNTILVPDNFLSWANSRYSGAKDAGNTRLIIAVNDIGDERIASYLNSRKYLAEGGNDQPSKASGTIKTLAFMILGIGVLIIALSFIILFVSILLLIQKNRDKIADLKNLGYSSKETAIPYQILVCLINVIIWILAFSSLLLIRPIYLSKISEFSGIVNFNGTGTALLAGSLFLTAFCLIDSLIVFHKIKKLR